MLSENQIYVSKITEFEHVNRHDWFPSNIF